MARKIPITLCIDQEELKKLDVVAEQAHLNSRSELINTAIKEVLASRETMLRVLASLMEQEPIERQPKRHTSSAMVDYETIDELDDLAKRLRISRAILLEQISGGIMSGAIHV